MIFKIKKRKFKYIVFTILFLLFSIFFSLLIKKINTPNIDSKLMYVHYINVDQGDSILIQKNNKSILIDSGPKSHKKQLIKFLNSLNISTLDYVIATHPHDDHIGNMNTLINSYKIKAFYAPKVYSNSKSFEQMIDALKSKNLKIHPIKRNCNTINLGPDISIQILSPINDSYDNENNYSPIIKVLFGNTSFLFTGDAESEVENQLLSLNDNLKADVLKIGHHGSSSSTSDYFLSKVNPKYAVISVGKDNIYGHPNKNTLLKLKNLNINILRTDILNNITFISDGKNITYTHS